MLFRSIVSILKLKILDFKELDLPRTGWRFLGYDTSGGTLMPYGALAEMDDQGNIHYIVSGVTTGIDGTSGISGSSGVSGTSGKSGTAGTSGITGNTGNNGSGGTSGTSGADGSYLGTDGTSGETGSSGTSGIGSSGTSGSSTSGSSGRTGTSGSSGSSGKDGNFLGSSGTSGSGISGSSGTSGIGSSGTSGTSGINGINDLNSFTWIISDPEVGGIPGPKIHLPFYNYDYDGLRIDSYISGGTDLTFNIQNRYNDEILVSGTTIYSGTTTSLILSGDSTSFFRYSASPYYEVTLHNDSWLWLNITNITGTPSKFVVTIFVNVVSWS